MAQLEGEIPDSHVITVRERRMTVDYPTLIQNNWRTDTVDLDLDGEWDGMQVILNIGDSNPIQLQWKGTALTIPASVAEEVGSVDVSLNGYSMDGKTRLVTVDAPGLLNVIKSGYVATQDPGDEPESLLGQLLEAAESAETAATAASSAASAASTAADSANSAASSASSAASAASKAAEDASSAAGSANSAASNADEAASSASTAAGSATTAAAAANQAAEDASSAATSATAAATAANEAAEDAREVVDIASTAVERIKVYLAYDEVGDTKYLSVFEPDEEDD